MPALPSSILQNPRCPFPTAPSNLWGGKEALLSHPHPQLPLPAKILLSWHSSESQISSPTVPPGELGATVSWIILKASEAVRTWQRPCQHPPPPPLL